MQHYFVHRDRRSYVGSPKGWKSIAPYNYLGVVPLQVVPPPIQEHWNQNKKAPFFYATIEGLDPKHLPLLVALAKGGRVGFESNRWGDISRFKIRALGKV